MIYSKVLLLILETPNSTVEQKWTVLQALLQICKNPQALVDIFVNYDCGLEGENIFERLLLFHLEHFFSKSPYFICQKKKGW